MEVEIMSFSFIDQNEAPFGNPHTLCVLEAVVLEGCLRQAVGVSPQAMWAGAGATRDWGSVKHGTMRCLVVRE
jgi:hypothetical protein